MLLLLSAINIPGVKTLAAVRIGVTAEPIVPPLVARLTVPDVMVTAPDLLIEPNAFMVVEPDAPVETFAFMLISLLFACNHIAVVPDIAIAPAIVMVSPENTLIGPVVPEIAPRVVVLEAPDVLMFNVLAPIVIVCPDEVKAPALSNCSVLKLALDTSRAPPTVIPPAWDVVPILNMLAVMPEMSDVDTLKVPPPEATDIDFAPLGCKITVPEPPLFTEPAKATSFAVIIKNPPPLIVVDTALDTLPVPSVVMDMPVVAPVISALIATEPLDPEDV